MVPSRMSIIKDNPLKSEYARGAARRGRLAAQCSKSEGPFGQVSLRWRGGHRVHAAGKESQPRRTVSRTPCTPHPVRRPEQCAVRNCTQVAFCASETPRGSECHRPANGAQLVTFLPITPCREQRARLPTPLSYSIKTSYLVSEIGRPNALFSLEVDWTDWERQAYSPKRDLDGNMKRTRT